MNYYIEWVMSTWFGVLHHKDYCPLWDAKLNELLDKYSGSAILVGACRMQLGGTEVWIENRMYSYGHLADVSVTQRRPSVRTMIRLAKLEDSLRGVQEVGQEELYRKKIEEIV